MKKIGNNYYTKKWLNKKDISYSTQNGTAYVSWKGYGCGYKQTDCWNAVCRFWKEMMDMCEAEHQKYLSEMEEMKEW